MVNLEAFWQPSDVTDYAPAWARAVASGEPDIACTPGATYKVNSQVVIDRVMRISGAALFVFDSCGGFKFGPQSSGSRVSEISAQATGTRTLDHHAFHIEGRVDFDGAWAKNFGGDGFHVSAGLTRTPPSNANIGTMQRCWSTGHLGRGFSWTGPDANAWSVVACNSSGCGGDYLHEVGCHSYQQLPCTCIRGTTGLVGGFHDHSFLGNHFHGCHGGNQWPGALGWALDGDSSCGSVVGCYQESSNAILVRKGNTAIGNFGTYHPNSDGLVLDGPRSFGRMTFGNQAAGNAKATVEMGAPRSIDGAVMEFLSALDSYGYSLRRFATGGMGGWWALVRNNQATGAVLAFRGDGKLPGSTTQPAPAELWAPKGLLVGAGKRLVDDAWMAQIEARLAALESAP